jgi:hypothetical protein
VFAHHVDSTGSEHEPVAGVKLGLHEGGFSVFANLKLGALTNLNWIHLIFLP